MIYDPSPLICINNHTAVFDSIFMIQDINCTITKYGQTSNAKAPLVLKHIFYLVTFVVRIKICDSRNNKHSQFSLTIFLTLVYFLADSSYELKTPKVKVRT